LWPAILTVPDLAVDDAAVRERRWWSQLWFDSRPSQRPGHEGDQPDRILSRALVGRIRDLVEQAPEPMKKKA
jgi:hypothetical protein